MPFTGSMRETAIEGIVERVVKLGGPRTEACSEEGWP